MELKLNLGDIYALLTALCWASAVILFKVSTRKLGDMQINLLKNTIGTIGFVSVLLLQRNAFPEFNNREWLILIMSGALGIAIGDLFFLACLRRLGAGLSALVATVYSPSIFLFAFLMFNETISLAAYFGGFLVISGIAIGTVNISEDLKRDDIAWGILYGVAAQALTAFSVLFVRPLMDSHDIVPIALVRFSTAIVIGVVFITFTQGISSLKRTYKIGFKHFPLIAGSILGSFISVILWLAGFKYTLAGRAAIYNQLSTVLIIIFAAIFLKEAMTGRKWIAVLMALAGAVIVSIS